MFHKVSKVVLYDRCNTFARFSEDGLHVSRQAQHFGGVHVHLCGKRSTLGVYCCVLFCRITLLGLRQVETTCNSRGRSTIWCRSVVCGMSLCAAGAVFGTLYTLHSTLRTRHFTPSCSTLYTLHFTLRTLHFTFHTLHLYTPHSTLYTPHFTLYTLHWTLRTPQSPLHTLHTTFPTQHSTVYTGTATGEECTRLLK